MRTILPLPLALLLELLPLLAQAQAHAQTVYACRRDGVAVFQDRPCGEGQVVRTLVPPPAGASAPGIAEMVAAYEGRAARARGGVRTRPRAAARAEPQSHRCTVADGSVFYRHAACPARIAPTGSAARGKGKDAALAVSDEPIARATACREMARAGALTRRGHEQDVHVDTYDRNLGRDPCR